MSKLLRGPLCCWMSSDAKMQYSAAIMRQHQEHEEQPEGCGWNNKEVGRDYLMDVIGEEGLPGLRGWSAWSDKILADGGFTDIDAKLEEFAMNTRSAPTRIGQAHPSDEIANFAGLRRSSRGTTALPGPVQSKPFTVPGNDSVRLHDPNTRVPALPQTR